MGIDVAWIKESGEATQEVHDPRQCLTQLATSVWPKLENSVCLKFVDPWGDTVFNQAQMPVLLAELDASLLRVVEPEIKAHVEKVIRLVRKALDQTHTYVKFIGD